MTNIEDPSYQAHIEDAARACSCCRECSEHPCPGCLAGGVCDEASCSCHDDDEDDDRDEMAIKSMQFDEACVVLSEAGIEVDRYSSQSLASAIRQLHAELTHARAAIGELHEHLELMVEQFREETGEGDGIREEHFAGYCASKSLVKRMEPGSKAWEDAMITLHIQREKASEAPGLTATLDEARHEVARLQKLFDDAGEGQYNVLALIDAYQSQVDEAEAKVAELLRLHPRSEYDEDRDGFVLWWRVPIEEPPFVGAPYFEDFPEHATHWTRIPIPYGLTPSGELEGES